jgi:nitroreductase
VIDAGKAHGSKDMEINTAIRNRRSIRAFTGEAVSEAEIRDLLDVSRWAPSWANTQSITTFVVSGAALEAIKDAYRTKNASQTPREFDIPPPKPDWPAIYAARTRQLRAVRSAIEADKPGPSPIDFYGAPVVLFLAVDEALQPEYAAFDAGLLTQTLSLAAHARGLGTVIMAMAVGYPDVLRRVLEGSAGKRFIIGIALGHPDEKAPVNRFPRERASLDEQVSWVR